MVLKLSKSKPAEATQTTENKTKGQMTSSVTENLDTAGLPGQTSLMSISPMADIHFGLSYTHNLGDFKSTRVEVGVTLPTPLDDLEASYGKAKAWVEEKMQPIVSELIESN
jgi:hypothetical protein